MRPMRVFCWDERYFFFALHFFFPPICRSQRRAQCCLHERLMRGTDRMSYTLPLRSPLTSLFFFSTPTFLFTFFFSPNYFIPTQARTAVCSCRRTMSSFPCFPACDGPMSMKQFLSRYFLIDVVFTASASGREVSRGAAPSDPQTASLSRQLALPLTAHLVLSVYVLKSAPPPPMWSPTDTAASSLAFAKSAQHRRVTRAILSDPFFSVLFTSLGPAVEAYVLAFCPVIAQFEAAGGGLQVLGPSLLALVPVTATSRARPLMPTAGQRKRVRSHDDGDGHARRTRRSVWWSGQRHRDADGRRLDTACHADARNGPTEGDAHTTTTATTTTTTEVVATAADAAFDSFDAGLHHALLSLDVGRTVLLNRQPGRMPRWATPTTTTTSACASTQAPTTAMPERWMDALWDTAHARQAHTPEAPSSLPPPAASSRASTEEQVPAHQSPPRRRRRRRRRHHRRREADATGPITPAETFATAPVAHVPDAIVPRMWVPIVFPFTWAASGGEHGVSENRAATLAQVLNRIAGQCRTMDIRGLTLRHTQFLEARFAAMQQAQHRHVQKPARADKAGTASPPAPSHPFSVAQLIAPVDIVVSYLRDVLARLRWPPRAPQAPCAYATFWGSDEVSATHNVDALCRVLRDWLLAGRRGVFRLSRFLDGVRVRSLPWLSACTTPAEAARALLECVFFLTQHVLPFFIERAFHVTWSSRDAHTLVFIPVVVWRRLVRRELRQWSRSPHTAPHAANDAHDAQVGRIPGSAVHHVQCAHDVWQHARDQPVLLPRVLYASVRFLPDRHKLRPIAVVRAAHAHALGRLARGLPARTRRAHATSAGSPACRPPPPPPPPALLLRTALACLVSGLDAHRAAEGLPPLTNRTHKDEYPELRALATAHQRLWRDYLTAAAHPHKADASWTTPFTTCTRPEPPLTVPVLSLLHADATRCYDRLPQSAVASAIEALIAEDALYYPTRFTALQASTCRVSHLGPLHGATVGVKRARSPSRPAPPLPPLPHQPRSFPNRIARVRQFAWERMIPATQLQSRQILCIPRATILCEPSTPPTRPTEAATAHGVEGLTGSVVHGAAVRALLLQHTQAHLIVVRRPPSGAASSSSQPSGDASTASTPAALFCQSVGITQGSPVAMLLCDVVLQHVDAALMACLSAYHEHSLLLRRVDDVLVASSSPIAAAACVAAFTDGWEAEVGYRCEPSKLQYVQSDAASAEAVMDVAPSPSHVKHGAGRSCRSTRTCALPADDALVSWCGLRMSAHTAEVAVDWPRVHPIIAVLHRTTSVGLVTVQDGGAPVGEARLFTNVHRLLTILALRCPPITLCRVVNSRARVLRTIYELSLLCARFLLRQFALMLPRCRPRRRLLLGPYRFCERRLVRFVERRQEVLAGVYHSFCDVAAHEVRLCVCVAMHRTLQSQLRRRLATRGGTPAGDVRTGPPSDLHPSHPSDKNKKVTAQRRQLWWGLAQRFAHRCQRAIRRDAALHHMKRVRDRVRDTRKEGKLAGNSRAVPTVPWCAVDHVSAGSLLLASGPQSLTALALAAVRRKQ